jgi:leader peptidase (prepilin peptidase) / N-methyltransferase
VVHRLPLMLERQWWGDVAAQLADAESYRACSAPTRPERLTLASRKRSRRAICRACPLGLAGRRSRCPACGHRIRWYENIPVLSWLALRGRARPAARASRLRYPLVELPPRCCSPPLAWRFGAQPAALLWCAAVAVLLALALIDWDTTVLPDALTLPLLWAGLVAAALGWLPG